MAYAQLARLPSVVCLYSTFIPTLAYALLGTSKHISLGMIAILSLMVETAQQGYYTGYNLSSNNITRILNGELDPESLDLLTPLQITLSHGLWVIVKSQRQQLNELLTTIRFNYLYYNHPSDHIIGWTNIFEPLPLCVLSCIIVKALQTMLKQFLDIFNIYKKSLIVLSIWIVTFLGVILWEVSPGRLIGIGYALLTVIIRVQWLKTVMLAKIGKTYIYKDIRRYKASHGIPYVFIYRFDAPLIFINCENFKTKVNHLLDSSFIGSDMENNNDNQKKCIIFDCTGITSIDLMNVKCIKELYFDLKYLDDNLLFAGCKFPLLKMFEKCGTYEQISKDFFFPSIHDVVLYAEYFTKNQKSTTLVLDNE
uniref:FI18412p1 (inferred by orthology to a D. melanogaster protein) n=1 Tax=Strongyloides venezuelensis TaxID=75913 RepID=A0A0K0F0T4_STRVS